MLAPLVDLVLFFQLQFLVLFLVSLESVTSERELTTMGDPNIPRALRSNTTLPNATSSPYRTFSEIRTAILASTDNAELTFSNIPPSIGPSVFDALSEDHSIENLTPR